MIAMEEPPAILATVEGFEEFTPDPDPKLEQQRIALLATLKARLTTLKLCPPRPVFEMEIDGFAIQDYARQIRIRFGQMPSLEIAMRLLAREQGYDGDLIIWEDFSTGMFKARSKERKPEADVIEGFTSYRTGGMRMWIEEIHLEQPWKKKATPRLIEEIPEMADPNKYRPPIREGKYRNENGQSKYFY